MDVSLCEEVILSCGYDVLPSWHSGKAFGSFLDKDEHSDITADTSGLVPVKVSLRYQRLCNHSGNFA
jgi:hypothetical protein